MATSISGAIITIPNYIYDLNYEDLVNWLKFSSKNIDNELIEEIVKKYQNWPNINNLIIHIENTMSWKYSENKVFNIFEMQNPITNIGKIKYDKNKIRNNRWIRPLPVSATRERHVGQRSFPVGRGLGSASLRDN